MERKSKYKLNSNGKRALLVHEGHPMNRPAEGTLVLAWGGVSKEQSLERLYLFFPIDLLVKTVSRRKHWSGRCIEGCAMGFRELFAARKVGLARVVHLF